MNPIAIELRSACDGHPFAKIDWPHRILHQGADEIERLELALAEAERRNHEINLEMSGVRRSYHMERRKVILLSRAS